MERNQFLKDKTFRSIMMIPGKSGQGNETKWLPLWIHAMDTDGIMKKLLTYWLSERTKQALCLDGEELLRVCRLLALDHDIGKLTPGFMSRILPAVPGLKDRLDAIGLDIRTPAIRREGPSHALAGAAILNHYGCPQGIRTVIGAHHGRPISSEQDRWLDNQMERYAQSFYGPDLRDSIQGQYWTEIRETWLAISLDLVGYQSTEELPQLDISTQLLLTGLLVMADWIASNQAYYPLLDLDDNGEGVDLEERTEVAWERFSPRDIWSPPSFSPDEAWFEDAFGFSPNEEQKTIIEAAGGSTDAGIYILEAQMGRGKTEAALAAAEILAGRNGCSGLFFGLPTQATANGIFPRLKDWGERQAEDLVLTIRLAHGMAALNEDYRELFRGSAEVDEDGDGGLVVHSWFRGKKQVLLSDFVIGTVDQLLMAALKQKHVMLRHLGLAGKVVILDECHAYDAYMNRYLDRALNWLGRYGVPVIILSATLPAERRTALVDAYLDGKDPGRMNRSQEEAWRTSRAYPLLTWTQGPVVRQTAIPVHSPSRKVLLGRLKENDLTGWLRDQLCEGGCGGVIVNTVRRAQELAKQIEKDIPDAQVIVLHSQFIMPDRAEKETELTRRIGKHSTAQQRNRLVVVGTQVLEQSLDIDFDCMVTDLCPMDLLLQRIGRLHRHVRSDRPDRLRQPVCMVMGTEELEPGSKAVYGQWLLMRTRELLPEVITLPDSIPELVQDTYEEPDSRQEADRRAWNDYITQKQVKERKASAYRLNSPEEFVNFPELNTINGWLDDDVVGSDVRAEAKVRDTDKSFSVLVMVKDRRGFLRFLPWQNTGKPLPPDRMPEEDLCRRIAAQKISLPRVFCVGEKADETIEVLENENRFILPEWQNSAWLKEELILMLDEDLEKELCGYHICYSRGQGLIYRKMEVNEP